MIHYIPFTLNGLDKNNLGTRNPHIISEPYHCHHPVPQNQISRTEWFAQYVFFDIVAGNGFKPVK